jgi:hypothetical protein
MSRKAEKSNILVKIYKFINGIPINPTSAVPPKTNSCNNNNNNNINK